MATDTPLLGEDGIRNDNVVGGEKRASIFRQFRSESGKLWKIAGPAIFTSITQYSLGALTQIFVGQLSEIDLAAVSVGNSVVGGFAFGVMVDIPVSILYC